MTTDDAKYKDLKTRYEAALKVINNSSCPYWGMGEHITTKDKNRCPYCKARMAWDSLIATFGDLQDL